MHTWITHVTVAPIIPYSVAVLCMFTPFFVDGFFNIARALDDRYGRRKRYEKQEQVFVREKTKN